MPPDETGFASPRTTAKLPGNEACVNLKRVALMPAGAVSLVPLSLETTLNPDGTVTFISELKRSVV